jgi:hypothetical protein
VSGRNYQTFNLNAEMHIAGSIPARRTKENCMGYFANDCIICDKRIGWGSDEWERDYKNDELGHDDFTCLQCRPYSKRFIELREDHRKLEHKLSELDEVCRMILRFGLDKHREALYTILTGQPHEYYYEWTKTFSAEYNVVFQTIKLFQKYPNPLQNIEIALKRYFEQQKWTDTKIQPAQEILDYLKTFDKLPVIKDNE